jgi:hypothetical protein
MFKQFNNVQSEKWVLEKWMNGFCCFDLLGTLEQFDNV